MFRTTSDAIGAAERMNDSSQPVHSWPCSQITTGKGFDSAASTTFETMLESSPIRDVSATHPFKKSRRLRPLRR